MSSADDFTSAMRAAGLALPDAIEPGRLPRFPGIGKPKRNTAGWCRFFEDGRGGVFGDWASGFSETWFTPSDRASLRPVRAVPRLNIPSPKVEPGREAMRAYALKLWRNANRADATVATHSYAKRKHIGHAYGAGRAKASGAIIGRDADVLVVPIRRDGTGDVIAVQAVNADGAKQTFGLMNNAFLLLGNEHDRDARWVVVEGWATGYAYSVAWRRTVVCVAFGKIRLGRVAECASRVHYPHEIVVLEEADGGDNPCPK